MNNFINLWSNDYILNIAIAILILIVGLWIANFIAKKLEKFLAKMKFFNILEDKLIGSEENKNHFMLTFFIKLIYYVLVIFVIIAVIEKLGFDKLVTPLLDFLNPIFSYIPNVFAGILLLVVITLLANFSKFFSEIFFKRLKIDEKIKLPDNKKPLSYILSEIISLIIFLILLPGVLVSLKLDDILSPVIQMTNKFLFYIPNVIAALLILLVGWFIATKLRNILRDIISSFKLDEKIAVNNVVIFEGKLSAIISNIVYVLILIPVIIAALKYLGLEYVASPALNMLDILFQYIPNIIGVVIILVVAFYFGKLLEGIVSNILIGFGFDKYVEKIGLKSTENNYSKLIGKLIKIITVYFAIIQSIQILNFGLLEDLSLRLTLLLGQIIFGVIIIGIGILISNLVSGIIMKTNLDNKKVISMISRIAIVILTGAMGLRQMGIANEIINLAFGLIVGALAVAFAISFGIGGRDIANEKLKELKEYFKHKDN